MQFAKYYTGVDASSRCVAVTIDANRLGLFENEKLVEWVDVTNLIRLHSVHGQLRLAHCGREGWRLVFDDPNNQSIAGLSIRRSAGGRKVAGAGLVAAGFASLVTAALVGTVLFRPVVFARALPLTMERNLGDKIAPVTGLSSCTDPAANAALAAVLDSVDPNARKDGFTVKLVYSPQVNALALPGGRILVFSGLVEKAGDSDAVAGALAHEVAHVRRRHIAAQMVRQLGIQGVVKMIGGGGLANGASSLLSRKFSRDDETQADSDSVAMLGAANISPRTTADLFKSLSEEQGAIGNWLADHPGSSSREAKFRSSFRKGHRYRFVLTADEEEALYSGCRTPNYY